MALRGLRPLKACRKPCKGFTKGELLTEPRAHETVSVKNLPRSFFWGNVNGVNYLTPIRNQHIPKYCGSCWAFATTSSLSDRIKIQKNCSFPEIQLSPQVLVNCRGGGSCEGGEPTKAFEYIEANGLPDETCQNYEAVDGTCQPLGVCEDCVSGHTPEDFIPGTCSRVTNFTLFKVKQYGYVSGGSNFDMSLFPIKRADKIKAEIFKRGPVSCGIHATRKFDEYKGGVFQQMTVPLVPNHEVSLVGWGIDDATGKEYWIGRNSWGTYWGEGGLFRIRMHYFNLGVERSCTWGEPDETGISSLLVPQVLEPLVGEQTDLQQTTVDGGLDLKAEKELSGSGEEGTASSLILPEEKPAKSGNQRCKCLRKEKGPRKSLIKSPLPHTYLNMNNLPRSYDIRNLNERSYATINRNQHIPYYCGSCWAMATSSALSDRISLLRGDAYPEVAVSPQVLVNCVTGNETQGCRGGDGFAAYAWVAEHGIPDDSCQNYQAVDLPCTPENVCRNCDHSNGCWAVEDYQKYYVEEYGEVSGEFAMMAEIAARGPIACSICATDIFHAYSGGIFESPEPCPDTDHMISVSGYGEENGVKYWIVRNSWGTWWGEQGWIRMKRGVNTVGIEKGGCVWAVPKITW
eukprot:TRINITY_DN672_c0_g2_i11.p1 TRINITY_DN672_c0_g2~~TRINITY_DN672_c0_g2_i11.p1  ORF type:complete len:640 (-),score=83.83 TRINITY_DN672_c0_g2_i11:1276-3162(-)